MAWDKAAFDAAYQFYPETHMPGGAPSTRPLITCHYHKWAMKPVLAYMYSQALPLMGLDPSAPTVVVGAGFGWGIEALRDQGFTNLCGIDISAYVQTEMDATEEAEIRAQIVAGGLDPDTGRGAEILAFLNDGQPRRDPSIIVLNEDMQTNTSRQNIRAALGNNWPSQIIMEELVDDSVTDQEITFANNAANNFAGTQTIWFIYSQGDNIRTAQDLATLTGSNVIRIPDWAVF